MASAHTDDGDLRYDGLFDVLLKGHNGGVAKHSSARDVDHGADLNVQVVCIDTYLYLRDVRWSLFGLQRLVVTISVYLDYPLGNNDDLAEKNA